MHTSVTHTHSQVRSHVSSDNEKLETPPPYMPQPQASCLCQENKNYITGATASIQGRKIYTTTTERKYSFVNQENPHKEFQRESGRGSTVWEGGFGPRILYAGIIFPSKIQCIKNFEGGGGLRV